MIQVVDMSDEEKLELYRKTLTFDQLAKMHIELLKHPAPIVVSYDTPGTNSSRRECQFKNGSFRCSAEADYKIVFEEEHGDKPEGSVDTCLEHIYAMLSDAVEQKLVKISLRKVG